MKSTIMQADVPLCTGNHLPKYIYFCKNCAASKLPIDRVFFCSECKEGSLKTHGNHHGDRNPIDSEFFQQPYRGFKESVQTTNRMHFITQIRKTRDPNLPLKECTPIMNAYLAKNPPVYVHALALTPNLKIAEELSSLAYRKWIVEHLFWTRPPYTPTLNRTIENYVLRVTAGEQTISNEWNNFEVKLAPRSAAVEKLMEKSLECEKNSRNLEKQEKVSKMFLKILGCITDKEIEDCLKEIGELLKDKEMPAFVLQVGQLKLLELHKEGSKRMKEIISTLDIANKSPREKELYYYLSSLAEWKVVPPTAKPQPKTFYDKRNKQNYVIDRPEEYIRCLTSAISISKQPLYYACRALGYMAQANYSKAEEDFLEADKLNMHSDAMDNNHNLNRVLNKRDLDNAQTNLHKREIEYVANLAKYFKRSHLYQDLKLCCLELVSRQPKNAIFRSKLLYALIQLNEHEKAEEELQQLEALNSFTPQQLGEYEKRIQLIKAREEERSDNVERALNMYQEVIKLGKPSATVHYNYAAFLFKNRHEVDLNHKALEAVDTAIEIKPKQKFYELKYLILFAMGNMEEARAVERRFEDKLGKYAAMKDYIHQNT